MPPSAAPASCPPSWSSTSASPRPAPAWRTPPARPRASRPARHAPASSRASLDLTSLRLPGGEVLRDARVRARARSTVVCRVNVVSDPAAVTPGAQRAAAHASTAARVRRRAPRSWRGPSHPCPRRRRNGDHVAGYQRARRLLAAGFRVVTMMRSCAAPRACRAVDAARALLERETVAAECGAQQRLHGVEPLDRKGHLIQLPAGEPAERRRVRLPGEQLADLAQREAALAREADHAQPQQDAVV